MTTITDHPTPPVLPAARRAALRFHLLGRSLVIMLTAMVAVPLFVLWVTFAALAPITITAFVVLPVAGMVRGYVGLHRRHAAQLLGTPLPPAYRAPDRPGVMRRIWTILSDPASWRDATWLLLHAIVGFVTSTLAVVLFLGGVFYLIYPFLYWVTPQDAFGRPFGGWVEFHSVADSTVVMPLAVVSLGLWFLLQLPLTRAELALTRGLLGPR